MPKLFKKRSKKAGLPPGTLVYTGEVKSKEVKIDIFNYSESSFDEKVVKGIDECLLYKDKPGITWINIDGILKNEDLEKLGKGFNIHPLALEDILSVDQRPKEEDFISNIYIVLKMLSYNNLKYEIISEQISLIVGTNYLISFQEEIEGDVFNSVRERIRSGKGKTRRLGPDYLAYSLVDCIVDNYFIILEKVGERIELVEESILKKSSESSVKDIHALKREMIFLHRSVWPLREVVGGLLREDSELIKDSTKIYLRDVYDHTIQVMDTVETYRDILSGMLDIYLSSVSYKLNEVMRVLTIVSTVFTPPIFIAGIYGMNFEILPEIKWRYGYPFALFLMAASSLSMLFYFKKKRWI
jgi:magnesium transporter